MSEGLALKLKHNLPDVLAALDKYAASVQAVARPIILNKLGDQARVAGQRVIRKTYGITIEQLGRYMSVVPAGSSGRLEFKIVAVGKGFPMSLFKPRQVPGRGGGVSVVIKGRRVLIPHAFILGAARLDVEGGGQVFARGSYNAAVSGSGTTGPKAGKRRKRGIRERTGRSAFESTGQRFGRFAFGRNRFPISMLRSTTPPSALMNEDVVDAMRERIIEQAPSVIRNAIKFATTQ